MTHILPGDGDCRCTFSVFEVTSVASIVGRLSLVDGRDVHYWGFAKGHFEDAGSGTLAHTGQSEAPRAVTARVPVPRQGLRTWGGVMRIAKGVCLMRDNGVNASVHSRVHHTLSCAESACTKQLSPIRASNRCCL